MDVYAHFIFCMSNTCITENVIRKVPSASKIRVIKDHQGTVNLKTHKLAQSNAIKKDSLHYFTRNKVFFKSNIRIWGVVFMIPNDSNGYSCKRRIFNTPVTNWVFVSTFCTGNKVYEQKLLQKLPNNLKVCKLHKTISDLSVNNEAAWDQTGCIFLQFKTVLLKFDLKTTRKQGVETFKTKNQVWRMF